MDRIKLKEMGQTSHECEYCGEIIEGDECEYCGDKITTNSTYTKPPAWELDLRNTMLDLVDPSIIYSSVGISLKIDSAIGKIRAALLDAYEDGRKEALDGIVEAMIDKP